MEGPRVKLVIEQQDFMVTKLAALQMETIALYGSIDDRVFPLTSEKPKFSAKIVGKVIKYCEMHVERPTGAGALSLSNVDELRENLLQEISEANCLSAWDTNFVNVDQPTLYSMFEAARFLEVESLLSLIAKKAASQLKASQKVGWKKATSDEDEEAHRQLTDMVEHGKPFPPGKGYFHTTVDKASEFLMMHSNKFCNLNNSYQRCNLKATVASYHSSRTQEYAFYFVSF